MKKIIFITAIILVFSGCAILNPKIVQPVFPEPIFKGSPSYDATLSFDPNGFILRLNNKSSKSLHIVWDNSAIVENDKSYSLVPDGTKLINASERKPDLIIPAKTEVVAAFSSSSDVYYSHSYQTWVENDVSAAKYVLSIAVKNGSEQESLDFKFVVKEELVDDSKGIE